MCKPDMRSRDIDSSSVMDAMRDWRQEMTRLAYYPCLYVKVSGGFSEMDALPPEAKQGTWGSPERAALLKDTRMWAEHWLKETLAIFGPRRMMFGSDWPVCNVGGGGNKVSWMNWWSLVKDFVEDNMTEDDQANFWSGNALRAYGRDED